MKTQPPHSDSRPAASLLERFLGTPEALEEYRRDKEKDERRRHRLARLAAVRDREETRPPAAGPGDSRGIMAELAQAVASLGHHVNQLAQVQARPPEGQYFSHEWLDALADALLDHPKLFGPILAELAARGGKKK